MNLDNKYLAVGLSIAAVVVVGYQVFLRKPTKPVRKPMENQPMFSTRGTSNPTPPPALNRPQQSAAQQPGTGMAAAADQDVIIDYNSEILLQRITADQVQPYPREESPRQLGLAIFTRGEQEDETKTGPRYRRELEFKLNAIIIDRLRRVAIINDTILNVGDTIQGAVVKSIVKSKVVLEINKKQILLSTNERIKTVMLRGGKGER